MLTCLGKTILKLLNFDINMTKFGSSLQVVPLPSLPLPLCQYISKLICTMYLPTVQHLSMVYCTVTVFLSTVSIYFSLYLYLSTVFIYLLYLSVYRSFLLYTVSTVNTVSIFLQCSFIYSTQRLSICYVKLSSVPFYLQ